MEELPEGKCLEMANWQNSPYMYCNVLHNSSRNGDGEDLHFFFYKFLFLCKFRFSPWLSQSLTPSSCASSHNVFTCFIFLICRGIQTGYNLPSRLPTCCWSFPLADAGDQEQAVSRVLGAPMAQIPCTHLPTGCGARPGCTGQPCEMPGAPRHPCAPHLVVCLSTWMAFFVVHCLCYGRLYLRPTSLKNPQAKLTNKSAQWSLDTSLTRSWVPQKDCTTAGHLLFVFLWMTSFILQKLQCHLVWRESSLLFSWCYLLVYVQAARKDLAAWDIGEPCAAYTVCQHAHDFWISKVCKIFGHVMC